MYNNNNANIITKHDQSSLTLEGVQDKLNLGLVISPFTHRIDADGDIMRIETNFALVFDGTHLCIDLSIIRGRSISANKLALFLIRHHVHNFNLTRRGRQLSEFSTIYLDDVIHVNGGFDKYLATSWSKIMHSMNGNIDHQSEFRRDECVANGGHKPTDHTYIRQQTNLRDQNVLINDPNKLGAFIASIKKGLFALGTKNYASKVTMEGDKDHRSNVVDISMPVEEKPKEQKEIKVEPEISTSADYTEYVGKEYEFDYVINGEYAPDYVWRRNRIWGLIPRFSFVKVADDHFIRCLSTFLFYVFLFVHIIACLGGFSLFKKAIGEILLMAMLKNKTLIKYFGKCQDDFKGFCWWFYTQPIIMYIILRFLDIILTYVCNDDYYVYQISKFVLIFLIHQFMRSMKNVDLFYWPRLCWAVQPYYTRKIKILSVDTRKNDKLRDMRVQGQKTFVKIEDSHMCTFSDTYTKTFPFGYYEDGDFVIVDSFIKETKTVESVCELELVTQMFTTRNCCATVSSEALIERIAGSTNLGPHINNFRADHLDHDINNNAYRLASYIILAHRYHNNRSIDNQLFWRGDSLGLMKTREL